MKNIRAELEELKTYQEYLMAEYQDGDHSDEILEKLAMVEKDIADLEAELNG